MMAENRYISRILRFIVYDVRYRHGVHRFEVKAEIVDMGDWQNYAPAWMFVEAYDREYKAHMATYGRTADEEVKEVRRMIKAARDQIRGSS